MNEYRPKQTLQYKMRQIHRVLGYLMVGILIVYSLSGITLLFRTGDFLKRTDHVELALQPGLDAKALENELKIKNFKVTEETDATIYFDDGQYDKSTGKTSYAKKEVVQPFRNFIGFHKVSQAKNPVLIWFGVAFGTVLFLLPVTALFMYKPSSRPFRANMVYLALGVILALVLVLIV